MTPITIVDILIFRGGTDNDFYTVYSHIGVQPAFNKGIRGYYGGFCACDGGRRENDAAAGIQFRREPGRVAGAGIDQHIHFHLVPRWNGDTNFMPTLADTKLVSESIQATYKKLKRNLSSKEIILRLPIVDLRVPMMP